jgi:hypothetical protein
MLSGSGVGWTFLPPPLDEKVLSALLPEMRRAFLKLGPQVLLLFVSGLVVILSFAGCWKKSGLAVVLEKEHIAAREATPTPKAESSASLSEPAASPNASTSSEEIVREMHDDETDADGYVMKKDVRGTSEDPRAMDHEQWLVTVRMIQGGTRFNVQTDQPHWEKLKIGDQVHVTYRQGKYTGTVWDSEIK